MSDNKNTDWLYSETVKEHFFSPKNIMKDDEETFEADGMGLVGNPQCGDLMKMWIKIDRENDKIIDCKWKTYGCASAIGSTSMLSIMVTENGGMKIDDALNIKANDIISRLGGLPQRKIHCSVLGDRALREAVYDYFRKSKQEERIPKEVVKEICHCLGVTDKDIEEAYLDGADTLEKIQERTKAGTSCGNCKVDIEDYLSQLKSKYTCSAK